MCNPLGRDIVLVEGVEYTEPGACDMAQEAVKPRHRHHPMRRSNVLRKPGSSALIVSAVLFIAVRLAAANAIQQTSSGKLPDTDVLLLNAHRTSFGVVSQPLYGAMKIGVFTVQAKVREKTYRLLLEYFSSSLILFSSKCNNLALDLEVYDIDDDTLRCNGSAVAAAGGHLVCGPKTEKCSESVCSFGECIAPTEQPAGRHLARAAREQAKNDCGLALARSQCLHAVDGYRANEADRLRTNAKAANRDDKGINTQADGNDETSASNKQDDNSDDSAVCCDPDTAGCAWDLTFGPTIAAGGVLVIDSVAFGGKSADGIVIYKALEQEKLAPAPNTPQVGSYDGVLGVCGKAKSCSPTCTHPAVTAFTDEASLSSSSFSVCYGLNGGIFTLGGIDQNHVASATPVEIDLAADADAFSTSIKAVQVKGASLQLASTSTMKMIFQPNQPFLWARESIYEAIRNQMQSDEHLCASTPYICPPSGAANPIDQTIFAEGGCAPLHESQLAALPTLSFVLENGANLTLDWPQYMLPIDTPSLHMRYWCYSVRTFDPNLITKSFDLLLGSLAFNGKYTHFDRRDDHMHVYDGKDCEQGCSIHPDCESCAGVTSCFWCASTKSCNFRAAAFQGHCDKSAQDSDQCAALLSDEGGADGSDEKENDDAGNDDAYEADDNKDSKSDSDTNKFGVGIVLFLAFFGAGAVVITALGLCVWGTARIWKRRNENRFMPLEREEVNLYDLQDFEDDQDDSFDRRPQQATRPPLLY